MIPAFTQASAASDFDASREPLRAIRDLINACEGVFGSDCGDDDILRRAQEGFTALRAEFGDTRPGGEEIAAARMHEPRGLREALELTAGALQNVAPLLKNGERHIVIFNGRWLHIAPMTIKKILDRADAALEPVPMTAAQAEDLSRRAT